MNVKDLFNLEGKTAIVTGGGRGLGEQMATGLAEAGSNIVVCSRKLERCEEVAQRIRSMGVKTLAFRCDVAREEDVHHVVKETMREFGGIDILVNNSGRTWGDLVEEFNVEGWKKVIDVNVTGTFLMTQKAGREMIKQKSGKVINIASYAGLRGTDTDYLNAIAYNTSKGAVVTFTKDLAVKWAKYGIHVNAIAPGWLKSELTKLSMEHFRE